MAKRDFYETLGVAKTAKVEISDPAALSPETQPPQAVEETKAEKPAKAAKASKKAKAEDAVEADA